MNYTTTATLEKNSSLRVCSSSMKLGLDYVIVLYSNRSFFLYLKPLLYSFTEESEENQEDHFTTSEDEDAHPPLRMKIIVTSPSAVKEKAPPPQTASIVSETITQTSYFGEAPPDHPTASTATTSKQPTVDVAPPASSSNEPSSEDLIRQHLNKMPGS